MQGVLKLKKNNSGAKMLIYNINFLWGLGLSAYAPTPNVEDEGPCLWQLDENLSGKGGPSSS